MIFLGVDAGSRTIKAVLLDDRDGGVVAADCRDQGPGVEQRVAELLQGLFVSRSLTSRDVAGCVATGYGRGAVPGADVTITEITCQARGIREATPGAQSVIDMGGQDSKVICLEPDGTVRDFAMNDRCAAGTGRFLEVVASRLEVGLDDLGALARTSTAPATISSTCVVFAETEIVGLLAECTAPADIVAGVQSAMAGRVAAMGAGLTQAPIVFTGGVALVPGMAEALSTALGQPVQTAPDPQFTAALGAALLARERTT